EWNGSNWFGPFTPATRPAARSAYGLAYDSVLGVVMLFGGQNGHPLGDYWAWNGNTWAGPIAQTATPTRRYQHAVAYDSGRGRVVLFGGLDEAVFQDDV